MRVERLLCAVCFLSAHSLCHSGPVMIVIVTLANTYGSAVSWKLFSVLTCPSECHFHSCLTNGEPLLSEVMGGGFEGQRW